MIGRAERGLTLMEVTVVLVLASVVTLGLVGFYLNSQATWTDASTQAVTQREATLLLGEITDRARAAASATWDATSHSLHLWDHNDNELARFTWDVDGDSLVLEESADRSGPVVNSVVTRFDVTTSDSLVAIGPVELRSAAGGIVSVSTDVMLYNSARAQ